MVLAFLQGEIDSPRFGSMYYTWLYNFRLNRADLIDNADLASQEQNAIRIELLKAVRGYRAGKLLFRGFPADVRWLRISLTPEEFPTMKYANHETWVVLSGGSRLVIDGGRNIECIPAGEDANVNIRAVTSALKNGKRYPPLIGVRGEKGDIILTEGHTRATAYVVAELRENVELLSGSSPLMKNWAFY